jgi:hypothetical protein
VKSALLISLLAALAVALPDSAEACSFQLRRYSPAEERALAADAVRSSAAIVDAVVELPTAQTGEAIIRPTRVLRGRVPARLVVIAIDSCSAEFMRRGDVVRVILRREPEGLTASQWDNGLQFIRASEKATFDREVDRLVASPRPPGLDGLSEESPPR